MGAKLKILNLEISPSLLVGPFQPYHFSSISTPLKFSPPQACCSLSFTHPDRATMAMEHESAAGGQSAASGEQQDQPWRWRDEAVLVLSLSLSFLLSLSRWWSSVAWCWRDEAVAAAGRRRGSGTGRSQHAVVPNYCRPAARRLAWGQT